MMSGGKKHRKMCGELDQTGVIVFINRICQKRYEWAMIKKLAGGLAK